MRLLKSMRSSGPKTTIAAGIVSISWRSCGSRSGRRCSATTRAVISELRAREAQRHSAGVARRDLAAAVDPDVGAVEAADAMLDVVARAAAGERVDRRVRHPVDVVGMDQREQLVARGARLARRAAEHRGPGRAQAHLVGRDVPVEHREHRALRARRRAVRGRAWGPWGRSAVVRRARRCDEPHLDADPGSGAGARRGARWRVHPRRARPPRSSRPIASAASNPKLLEEPCRLWPMRAAAAKSAAASACGERSQLRGARVSR